jgi:hypothetical protein
MYKSKEGRLDWMFRKKKISYCVRTAVDESKVAFETFGRA